MEGYSAKVLPTVKEFVDLVDIGTDETPNDEEKGRFISEGGEALMAFFNLARDLPKSEYDEALEILGLSLLGKVAENKVQHSDLSGYKITIESVDPPEIPADPETPPGEEHMPG